jgi:uncharacterized CHY-type Zn-finger protein
MAVFHGVGVAKFQQSRCQHWHSELDVLALLSPCCHKYYSCSACHDALEDHPLVPWPAVTDPETPALLCGVCERTCTIGEYLGSGGQRCPRTACGAAFNPGCKSHWPAYFSTDLVQRAVITHQRVGQNPAPRLLTQGQLASFKRDGFVVVPGFFPEQTCDEWRRQVWAATTADASWWPGGDFCGPCVSPLHGSGPRNTEILSLEARRRLVYPYPDPSVAADPRPIEPPISEQPRSRAALDQLLGPGAWGAGIAAPPDAGAGVETDVVVCNWPRPAVGHPPQASEGGGVCGARAAGARPSAASSKLGHAHVEGFRPLSKGGPTSRWLVGMTLYLDDVQSGDGGTFVWPRSHEAVHRYFKRWPGDLRSGGALNDKLESDTWNHSNGLLPSVRALSSALSALDASRTQLLRASLNSLNSLGQPLFLLCLRQSLPRWPSAWLGG